MFLLKKFQLKLIWERNELIKFWNLVILGLPLVSPKTFDNLDGAITINHVEIIVTYFMANDANYGNYHKGSYASYILASFS
jgi:hypothetical protein